VRSGRAAAYDLSPHPDALAEAVPGLKARTRWQATAACGHVEAVGRRRGAAVRAAGAAGAGHAGHQPGRTRTTIGSRHAARRRSTVTTGSDAYLRGAAGHGSAADWPLLPALAGAHRRDRDGRFLAKAVVLVGDAVAAADRSAANRTGRWPGDAGAGDVALSAPALARGDGQVTEESARASLLGRATAAGRCIGGPRCIGETDCIELLGIHGAVGPRTAVVCLRGVVGRGISLGSRVVASCGERGQRQKPEMK
jgi:hypothetical protein